ncbi:MAG: hypothetical protein GTN86_00030 [Xanthomonadales bacterium]|nr:hypothetical protein [Xanthomonadales bacterium]NIN58259.1 hypothetical protein [Xanthomonadales bacterium]NIN73579.1 hypothetical protein [Xanthomonadales bacterium]NIO14377.1 hypothetical protein [Xanthomonadales bacterium]NIP10652.1 hypothetical protein [Xanthomonadales bacterium]
MRRTVLTAAFCVLVACQSAPPPSAPAAADWPPFDVTAVPPARLYRVDAERSSIDIVVRRDGPLARFGHDHVIVAGHWEGWVDLPEAGELARAELRMPVHALVVDPAAGRERYRLDTQPDAEAIASTRRNLLEHVLEADHWPFLAVSARHPAPADSGALTVELRLQVRGATLDTRVPLAFQRGGDFVNAEGFVRVRQTELGLEPFAALGGALRVADELEIHFTLHATRQASARGAAGRGDTPQR